MLPEEARHIERLRRRLLDGFESAGYELVMPPLLEYLESLLTGSGRDLDLQTFKLVDQLSGRTMGLRADITPQVARIDAQLLNRDGVVRLCYCGSVLHTLPASVIATREPLQLGAEIYGYAGAEADAEVIRLLAEALIGAGVEANRIDLGHVGIFKALMRRCVMGAEAELELLAALQAKDIAGLESLLARVAEPDRSALLALSDLYGAPSVLDKARRYLPPDPQIDQALSILQGLGQTLSDLPVSFDLADLRGYHYHNGVVLAAYLPGYPGAIALGGRYDNVGRIFGRGRPATGFSLDLRELARAAPGNGVRRTIIAPLDPDPALRERIRELRVAGAIVAIELPGQIQPDENSRLPRLVRSDGGWVVEAIDGDL